MNSQSVGIHGFQAGEDVNPSGRMRQLENELCTAAEAADLDALSCFLQHVHGAPMVSANARDCDGTPALVLVCSSGQPVDCVVNVARMLLSHGCNIDSVNIEDGSARMSALMAAISMDQPEVVDFLISAGANLRQCDSDCQNALSYALGAKPDTLKAFIESVKNKMGAQGFVSYAADSGALYHAARFGELESIRILLEAGLGVNDPDDQGRRPLDRLAAACYGDKAAKGFRHLIELGASVQHSTWRATEPVVYGGERGWATPKAMWALMLSCEESQWPAFSAKDAGFAPCVPVSRLAAAMSLGDGDALMEIFEASTDLRALQKSAHAIAARSMHQPNIGDLLESLALVDAMAARHMIRDINQTHHAHPGRR